MQSNEQPNEQSDELPTVRLAKQTVKQIVEQPIERVVEQLIEHLTKQPSERPKEKRVIHFRTPQGSLASVALEADKNPVYCGFVGLHPYYNADFDGDQIPINTCPYYYPEFDGDRVDKNITYAPGLVRTSAGSTSATQD
jgi:hypothetical protein